LRFRLPSSCAFMVISVQQLTQFLRFHYSSGKTEHIADSLLPKIGLLGTHSAWVGDNDEKSMLRITKAFITTNDNKSIIVSCENKRNSLPLTVTSCSTYQPNSVL